MPDTNVATKPILSWLLRRTEMGKLNATEKKQQRMTMKSSFFSEPQMQFDLNFKSMTVVLLLPKNFARLLRFTLIDVT